MNQTGSDLPLFLSRREGLRALLGAAAITYAIPARLSFAAPLNAIDSSSQRLVVVMLRGALDGLAVVPATGDPAWADLRGHAEAAARSQALTLSASGNSYVDITAHAPVLPLDMTFADALGDHAEDVPDAYERLIMDVIRGNQTLFMRGDEVEAAWAWTDPIIDGWTARGDKPQGYDPGSSGPEDALMLMHRDGRRWREIKG